MINILDIIIAKNKSFTGETEKLVREAKEAMAKANAVAGIITSAEEALSVATSAEAELTSLADTIIELRSDAAEAVTIASSVSSKADAALDLAESAITSLDMVSGYHSNGFFYRVGQYIKSGLTKTTQYTEKNYVSTGNNEDGSMTQKAITNAIGTVDTRLTSVYNELSSAIADIGSGGGGGGSISGDPGSIVIINDSGHGASGSTIDVGTLSRMEVISGTFLEDWASYDIAGLELDYENNSFTKVLKNTINAQTGRARVVVRDNGEIVYVATADGWFDLQGNAVTIQNAESGAEGQVMVYQPAFYYMRVPIKTSGNNILKEYLFVSDLPYSGFTLHPAFWDANGHKVDYVLLSAYEGSLYNPATSSYVTEDDIHTANCKLSSIRNVKPTTRNGDVNVIRTLASNRGSNWHVEDIYIHSLQQMLMIVEFGFINMYERWNYGISNITSYSGSANSACLTGSTADKYNTTARADSTIQTYPGVIRNYTNDGCCAISYRGYENPYGNLWNFLDKITVDVSAGTINVDGEEFNLNSIPSSSGYIKYFNKLAPDFVFFPLDISGNSSLNSGDYYIKEGSDQTVITGGRYSNGSRNGLFTAAVSGANDIKCSMRTSYTPNFSDTYYYATLPSVGQ